MKTKPVLPAKTEFKSFRFEQKAIDQDQGIITGYLSTFGNVDLQNDCVVKGAFSKTIAEAKSRKMEGRKFLWPVLWMHNPEQPIGLVIDASEDDHGLLITAQLDITTNDQGVPNNPKAVTVFSGFKMGYVDELSMGYVAIQKEYSKGIRYLKENAVLEASGVTALFAANPDALVSASGVKSMDVKPQKKDFNDLFQTAQAADCLEDWGDLINTLTQAMIQIFSMGDSPQPDMSACLDQFGVAVSAWLEDAAACNLAGYISDSYGYASGGTPYVPSSLRVGYMARRDLPAGKVGATISGATQGTLEAHQAEMKSSLDAVGDHVKTMQQKVSDLTQLWQQQGQGPAYADDNGKSLLTRREPLSPALSRQGLQPLSKNTAGDVSIDDLELLLI